MSPQAPICAIVLVAALAACGRQQMDREPKYAAYAASTRFPRRQSALAAVDGTVPVTADDEAAPERTLALLERGRERYGIYCSLCHGAFGDGDGVIVTRDGFPAPPSLHDERLRSAPDEHYWDVVTHGYGVMYPYATPLPPRDRWAVIGYVRALQLARRADVTRHPELRSELPP
jgi:mono/diheme cytochrome c family protein